MTEGIIFAIVIPIVGVAYVGCSVVKHRTCDIGKTFTLMIVVVGCVSGALIYAHAYNVLKTRTANYEDLVWGAVAGFILFVASVLQIVEMFRELFSKKIEPVNDIRR